MDRNRGLDINALRQQLEDLFEDFFPASPDRRRGHRGDQTQHLALNVAETDEAFTLTAPLPGFQPEDVDITVRGQNVAIRAQHKNAPTGQENLTRHEWGQQGTLQRSFELPAPVDADQTTASFRQGVVTITLPKSAASEVHVEAEEADTAEPAETAPEQPGAETPEQEDARAEAAPGQPEKASFYMAPARGRRGRRHGGKTVEPPPAPDDASEEQAAGPAEGESRASDSTAPADEAEAREQDMDEQSGFTADQEPVAAQAADAPEDAPASDPQEIDRDAASDQEKSTGSGTPAHEAEDPAVE